MNKEELIKEIKKSRKQNTNERYEYINSHFNQTNYAISLEKYVKELLKENKELKNYIKELEENSDILVSQVESWSKSSDDYLEKYKELHNKIDKAIEYIKKYQQIYDIDGSIEKHLDEFNILASPKRLLEILKGDVDEL